jgi:hypothetical protein
MSVLSAGGHFENGGSMDKRTWNRRTTLVLALTLVSLLGRETLRAEGERSSANQDQTPALHSLRVVDFFNLFPNVGAFVVWGEPNDFGAPEGLLTRCTGTLIDERVFLTAGHCVAWIKEITLPPSIKFFVTFKPNALEQSGWRTVAGHAAHPSLPPCPPPALCTFRGLDPGILDIGLIFLSEPVRGIAPATLARPNTLESDRAKDALMILPEYGDLDSVPGGGPQPNSEWDGWRRIKISKLRRVVNNEWASWSLPGVVCFGLGVAYLSFRHLQESPRPGDCCGGERRGRRLFLAGRSRSSRHRRCARLGAENHHPNDPKALRAQTVAAACRRLEGKTSSRSCQDEGR